MGTGDENGKPAKRPTVPPPPRIGTAGRAPVSPRKPADEKRTAPPGTEKPTPSRPVSKTPPARPAAPRRTPAGPTRPDRPDVRRLPSPGAPAPGAAKPRPPVKKEEPEPVRRARALIATCEAELGQATEEAKVARLHYEIARAHEEPIGDPRSAIKHYEAALEHVADHLPSIRGLRRLLLMRKPYQAAIPLFDAEIRVTSDPHRKAALHLGKGRALEDLVGDLEPARKCYAQAAELDPGNRAILKAVEQAERRAGAWEGLGRAYEQAAGVASGDKRYRAALLVLRARVLETHEKDLASATELYELALELDPLATGTFEALKRLLHDRSRWRDLIDVLEREAAQSSDPAVKASALFQVGHIHAERLGSREEAIKALQRAAEIAPRNVLIFEELATLYEADEKHAELARTLGHIVEIVEDEQRRFVLMHRLGELCEKKVGNPEAAISCYESVLGRDPTYVPVLRALGRLYSRSQQWEPLIRMHLAEASASRDSLRRADAHSRVAKIYETHLGDLTKAAEHYTQALALAPDITSSFKALTRLLAQAGRHRELIELYGRAIDAASDIELKIAYLFKIGALYEDSIGDAAEAAHIYRRVLKLSPKHLGAIHALQRAAEAAGRHQELAQALEMEAELTDDAKKLSRLIHRAGEVFDEKLGEQQQALTRYHRALELDPSFGPALSSLGRLYDRTGRWDDLLEICKRELELATAPPAKAALLHRMGDLCEDRIGDQDRAVGYYRKAIDVDPTYRPAFRALSSALYERRDWPAVVEMFKAELSRVDDLEEHARVAYRLGEVHETRTGDLEQAAAAYRKALEAVPEHRPARDGLARVDTQLEKWLELVTELEADANEVADERVSTEALFRAAHIWHSHLGNPKRAIACYEMIRQRDPKHVAALLALEVAYREVEDWEQVARVYSVQAETFVDSGARLAAMKELARVVEQHELGDAGDVRDIHLAILEIDARDGEALAVLERLAHKLDDRELLGTVYGRLVDADANPVLRSAAKTRLGGLLEGSDPEAAIAAYGSAVSDDPENFTAIHELRRLAEQQRDAAAFCEASRLEAGLIRDDERAAGLLADSAEARVAGLQDTAGAIEDLELALERWPDHATAPESLSELLLATGKVDHLIECLSRAAGAASQRDRKGSLWQAVARLQADQKQNLGAGIAALRRMLKLEPDHIPTLVVLAEMYERGSQWQEAADVLEQVAELAPKQAVALDAQLKLGRLYVRHLDDVARAVGHLKMALRLNPHDHEAMQLLAEASAREGDMKGAAAALKRLVREAKTPEERAAALVRVADVHLQIDDREGAIEALHEAVTLEGESGDAARRYRPLLQDADAWSRFADALAQHVAKVDAGELAREDVSEACVELAAILRERLDQPDRALKTLHELSERYPSDARLGLAYAEQLRIAGRHQQTIGELQRLVGQDPGSADIWRALARTFDALGQERESAAALAPLLVLEAADEKERAQVARRRLRPGLARPGSLDGAILPRLTGDVRGERVVVTLLATLAEAFSKIYPADLKSLGLSSRDRITNRAAHPLRAVAERVADVLGVQEFDLFVRDAPEAGAIVELSLPPSVIVSGGLSRLTEAVQVFVLARAMAPIGWGVHAALKLGPDELERALAAVARSVSPAYGAALDDGLLDDLSKRLVKATSRRGRKALQEAAAVYAEVSGFDCSAWVPTIDAAATRVATLLSGDLPECVSRLRASDPVASTLRGSDLVRGVPAIADVVRFWGSPAAFEIRGRAGLV